MIYVSPLIGWKPQAARKVTWYHTCLISVEAVGPFSRQFFEQLPGDWQPLPCRQNKIFCRVTKLYAAICHTDYSFPLTLLFIVHRCIIGSFIASGRVIIILIISVVVSQALLLMIRPVSRAVSYCATGSQRMNHGRSTPAGSLAAITCETPRGKPSSAKYNKSTLSR